MIKPGDRVSMTATDYEVLVGNDEYGCSSLGVFSGEREAERAGRAWMREMVAMEQTAAARREARESCYFEIRARNA